MVGDEFAHTLKRRLISEVLYSHSAVEFMGLEGCPILLGNTLSLTSAVMTTLSRCPLGGLFDSSRAR